MGCCWSAPPAQDQVALIVDLHKILADKAWQIYKASLGTCGKLFIRRKDFKIEVPDNYFVFEQIEQSIEPRGSKLHVKKPGQDSNHSDDNKNNRNNEDLAAKLGATRQLTSPQTVRLDTVFHNDTAASQTYQFRFEKQRRTEVTVECQKGYTLGVSTKFTIGLPLGGVEMESEATAEYQVSKTEGQTFEESLTMEATSDIHVGPHSKYVAQVQLDENKVMADFKVVMRMTMPQKKAPVYIKKKSDDTVVSVYSVNNLKDLFGYGQVPCAQVVKDEDGKDAQDKIDFLVEGVIQGCIASNHRIQLSSDETLEEKKEARKNYIHGRKEQEGEDS